MVLNPVKNASTTRRTLSSSPAGCALIHPDERSTWPGSRATSRGPRAGYAAPTVRRAAASAMPRLPCIRHISGTPEKRKICVDRSRQAALLVHEHSQVLVAQGKPVRQAHVLREQLLRLFPDAPGLRELVVLDVSVSQPEVREEVVRPQLLRRNSRLQPQAGPEVLDRLRRVPQHLRPMQVVHGPPVH